MGDFRNASMKDAMNRRQFTRTAVLAPIAVALGPGMQSQQSTSQEPAGNAALPPTEQHKPKSAAAYNRHRHIDEPDPFAGELIFARRKIRPRLQAFSLADVQLEAGPLKDARDWNRAYMMRLPNDRLLHNFRVNAGIASNAKPLGGWESPHSELRGHFTGHYLSAAAYLYAATRDAAVKEKADELVTGIAECQSKLNSRGYVSAFPLEFFERLNRREKVWAPFYTLHKIMAGLLDMSVRAGNSQALGVLLQLAEWVDRWSGNQTEAHMQDILNTEYGGMNDVLYQFAEVTGNDRWAHAGDRFTKKIFFTPLALRQDQLKGLHANTHMPQVVGAARRYELTSDARFGNVAGFFWETIAASRTYATGGSANTESWLTNAHHLALEIAAGSHHQECCCAYNMMKLTRHLYAWTADTRYVDYYERNLLNHRLGAIQPESGLTTYFLSMSPGAWKTLCTEDETFWCCTGTALEDFAKLNDSIYFHDDEGVYVNLFVPSRLNWKDRGIELRQSTNFPESGKTLFTVQASPTGEWTLHLRVPGWATASVSVLINGHQLSVAASPCSYLAIRRPWKTGDRIEFVTPMQLTAEPLTDDPSQQAFLFGPIVLAGQFPRDGIDEVLMHNQGPEIEEAPPLSAPVLKAHGSSLSDWIRPVPDRPLHFSIADQENEILLKPLNQSWDRFAAYWKVV